MPPKAPQPPPLHTVQESRASTQAAVTSPSKTTASQVTQSKSSSLAQTPQSATDPSAPCAGHSHVYDFGEYQDLYYN